MYILSVLSKYKERSTCLFRFAQNKDPYLPLTPVCTNRAIWNDGLPVLKSVESMIKQDIFKSIFHTLFTILDSIYFVRFISFARAKPKNIVVNMGGVFSQYTPSPFLVGPFWQLMSLTNIFYKIYLSQQLSQWVVNFRYRNFPFFYSKPLPPEK